DPDVSQWGNLTPDGVLFNQFDFISQAGGFGVQIWQGQSVMNCKAALPMAVTISPSQVDITKGAATDNFIAYFSFPASTRAAGYVARSVNVGGAGVRMRPHLIASPTL